MRNPFIKISKPVFFHAQIDGQVKTNFQSCWHKYYPACNEIKTVYMLEYPYLMDKPVYMDESSKISKILKFRKSEFKTCFMPPKYKKNPSLMVKYL